MSSKRVREPRTNVVHELTRGGRDAFFVTACQPSRGLVMTWTILSDGTPVTCACCLEVDRERKERNG